MGVEISSIVLADFFKVSQNKLKPRSLLMACKVFTVRSADSFHLTAEMFLCYSVLDKLSVCIELVAEIQSKE